MTTAESDLINEDDDEKEPNFKVLVSIIMILFFIGGIIIGHYWGGYVMDQNWQEYYSMTCDIVKDKISLR